MLLTILKKCVKFYHGVLVKYITNLYVGYDIYDNHYTRDNET